MDKQDAIITAIDVGTTKVCTLTAQVEDEQNVRILGVGIEPTQGIKKGMVVDIPLAANSIAMSIKKAERSSGLQIENAVVSVAGSHISSINNKATVGVVGGRISKEDVSRVLESVKAISIPSNRTIIHTIQRTFSVDGIEGIRSPKGMYGSRLDVEAHIITASESSIENLRQHNGYWLISCAAMIVMTLSYSIVFVTHVSLPEEDDKPYHLLEELGRTPDKYYVFDVPTINDFYTHTENYIHPMWGFSEDYLENIDSFGYFHNNEDLRKRNLPENIYQAVLRHNKIYVIDQALVFKKEKYFTENYVPNGKNAVYELIDEFDSYKIYKVVIL